MYCDIHGFFFGDPKWPPVGSLVGSLVGVTSGVTNNPLEGVTNIYVGVTSEREISHQGGH